MSNATQAWIDKQLNPEIAWRRTKPNEAWACYIDGAIAVRRLNNGTVQIKLGDETEWRTA